MGLLDDAIREHLDLKRRRGGDPVEIERAEREALGPVRRGPEGAESEPSAANHQEPEEQQDLEFEPESEWDERYAEDVEAPAPPEPHPGLAGAPPERGGPDTAEYDVTAERDHDRTLEPEAEHELGHETEPHHETEPRHETELHHDPELHHEPESDREVAPGRPEDPLEETPEFLQDTPEHDRLWFEQKPPKDFDFDE